MRCGLWPDSIHSLAQPPDGGRAWISLMSVLRFFGSRVSLAGKRVFREKQRSVFFPKSKEVKKP